MGFTYKKILYIALFFIFIVISILNTDTNSLTYQNQIMFTLAQIETAHRKVKSGAEFPKYIQEIKAIGVIAFETWVFDSHTKYFGLNDFQTQSTPKYDELSIANKCEKQEFNLCLKTHQKGETDYFTFCKDCAATGIEKWMVNLERMTCSYYDKAGDEILVEDIPSI